jgi:hypothetical protein
MSRLIQRETREECDTPLISRFSFYDARVENCEAMKQYVASSIYNTLPVSGSMKEENY